MPRKPPSPVDLLFAGEVNPPSKAEVHLYLSEVQRIIDEHGWMVQSVLATTPVTHTIGLTAKYGLPELVLMGVAVEDSIAIVNLLAAKLVANELTLDESATYVGLLGEPPAKVRRLPEHLARHLRSAACFTPSWAPVHAWQVLWPDESGRFPGEAGIAPSAEALQDLAFVLAASPRAPLQ